MARSTARTEAPSPDATPRRNAKRERPSRGKETDRGDAGDAGERRDSAPNVPRPSANRRDPATPQRAVEASGTRKRPADRAEPSGARKRAVVSDPDKRSNRRLAPAQGAPEDPEDDSADPAAPPVDFVRSSLASLRERLATDRSKLVSVLGAVGRVLVVLGALAGCAAVGRLAERHVRTSPAFAIRTLRVEGAERLTSEEVLRAAGLEVGLNVFAVPPEDVHARLVRHPWIAEATVRRRLPGTFEVSVRERRPAATILLDRLYLVGQDASVFKTLEPGDPIDLPVVTGVDLSRFTTDRAFRSTALLEVVALLHDFAGAGLASRASIEEIHFESDGSLSIYLGEDATYVRLGRAPYQAKLRRLRRIFDELARRDARAAYVYLDNVRRPDRVTVRLRETSVPLTNAVAAGSPSASRETR